MARPSILLFLVLAWAAPAVGDFQVLAFSKTAGFRHAVQIDAGRAALVRLGAANGFAVDFSEDEQVFNSATLAQYDVVVFLFTSGDILGASAESAFESYIAAGGGFVGIHSATDTEYGWALYGDLIAAYFSDHPAVQTATVVVVDATHPSTSHLAPTFPHTDEWYNFAANPNLDPEVEVLLEVDESTYSGGTMGARHPIAWAKGTGAGKSWYTAMGHTLLSDADYQNGFFDLHLLGGIQSVVPEASGSTALLGALLALVGVASAARRDAMRDDGTANVARAPSE